MKLSRLVLNGLSTAFPATVDLALDELPEGLVAVTGPNGQGKTMLLEATPAALYRQLPARDGKDPVLYATGRDSSLALEFVVAGAGTFRARLNLDGPKRQTDAVLEQATGFGPDVTWVPLNDGKRSTYDQAINDRFPSFDLFINSAFAAQGRGDEFTRRKPSQRKDLFVEFLALQHYATKAAAAAEAAELYADARLRLTVFVEQLERETAQGLVDALDRQANELQAKGGDADVTERELATRIVDIEARLALLADQVAANAAAADRVRRLEQELAVRRRDRDALDLQRQAVVEAFAVDRQRVSTRRDAAIDTSERRGISEAGRLREKRDAEVADCDKRIAGNQQILGMADAIRGAIAALTACQADEARLRSTWTERQAELRQAETHLRTIEKTVAALTPVEQRLARAERDVTLLGTVPCGGAGVYASCQFLTDAAAAREQIAVLKAELEPKAKLLDDVAAALREVVRLTEAVAAADHAVTACVAQQAEQQQHAKYAEPLAEATAKIDGYRTARVKAIADADDRLLALERSVTDAVAAAHTAYAEQLAEAQRRHDTRLAEIDEERLALDEALTRLRLEYESTLIDQTQTADGTRAATALQVELEQIRRDRDAAVRALAAAEAGRQELQRRREELNAKRVRLEDLRGRRARIEQDQLEWRDLAKALGKGGLPDLEIDQAGPSISATTNAILLECFGPRFSIELVTQVEKADGSGFKDEFTVRVMDNERSGGWRDISDLSGGQKVIVQEALMCAIALYVNERSSMPIRTLWRDETGAALDPENALAYVRMLRKVRELGRFHHVFFISHNTDAAALADAQILVGDGQARIALPPFQEAA